MIVSKTGISTVIHSLPSTKGRCFVLNHPRLFELALIWRIPNLKLQSASSNKKFITATKQQAELLATLRCSLDRARMSIQLTQVCDKRDFDWYLVSVVKR